MSIKPLTCLLAVCLLGPTAPALDLTPAKEYRDLEGFKIPILSFVDGKHKVIFQPPSDWNVSGGGNSLSLLPSGQSNTVINLRVINRRSAAEETTKIPADELSTWCRMLLPQDATDVVLTGEMESPFTLQTLPSRECTFSYAAQGRRFTTSVSRVDLNEKERLAMVVTALPQDFKNARESAVRSMFSWSWVN